MVSPRRAPDAGLTLVELMITLVIAGLVSSSTFVFFAGQQKVYETQGKLLNIQQNLWGAMEVLGRNVRAAGIGMANCVRPDSDREPPVNADPPPGVICTGVNPRTPTCTAGGPTPPATGVRVFRGGAVTRIPPVWIGNSDNGDPDMITVAFGTNTFGNTADSQLTADVRLGRPFSDPILTTGVVYRAQEFILLVDSGTPPINPNMDRGCTMFQITGVAGNQLDHVGNAWNPNADIGGLVPFTYPAGVKGGVRNFGQLNWLLFYIDRTGAPLTPPRLMMNRLDTATGPQVLADGIEDMQITYACDIAPPLPAGTEAAAPWTPSLPSDGLLTEGAAAAAPGPSARAAVMAGRLNDESIFNTPGEAVRADCNKPTAIRITLVARSLATDNALAGVGNNFKPGVEDGAAGPLDEYRHRVITTTINPRNRE